MPRPRIRTIKPEMWQDEKIGGLSRDSRLLFIGLITMADDEGRLRAIPSLVLGHVFPYDNVSPRNLDRWLADLENVGLLYRYEVAGVPYIALCGWVKHQRINRPSTSELPAPPHGALTDHSVNGHGTITEYSVPRTRGRAGGSDRIGSDQEPPSPPASRGSSSSKGNSRSNGTNPRALAAVAAADGITDLSADQAASADQLMEAVRAYSTEVVRDLWLPTMYAAGVDPNGTIVLSADAAQLTYITERVGGSFLRAIADNEGVSARFATPGEAAGLARRVAA